MWSDALCRLKVLGVHQQPDKIVPVQIQPEQHAATDIVNPAVHRPVHRLGMVGVVALRPCRVQLLVRLFIVGFLEQNICADARLLQAAVIFHGRGGNIHVHTADRAVFMLNRIYRFDAVENVLDRVVHRVFARLDRQPLMPHILQRNHLAADFVLRELFAADGLVFVVVRTVNAAVYAVIRQVQRREHYDTVAVEFPLDFPREREHFLVQILNIALQKHRRLAVRQPLAVLRTLNQSVNQPAVRLILLCIAQSVHNLLIIYKLLCFRRLNVVHSNHLPFLVGCILTHFREKVRCRSNILTL